MTAILSTNGPGVHVAAAAPRKPLVATTHGAAVLERDGLNLPWRHTGTVLGDKHLSSMMITPDGSIFAGVHNGGLLRSTDDGLTWQPRGDGITIPHVYSLACQETADGVALYAGTEPVGLFRDLQHGLLYKV